MIKFCTFMDIKKHPTKRNKVSRLFFGLFFDEWSEKSGPKSYFLNHIIDAALFTVAVVCLIWFSLNNTFSLTHETLTKSWNELEPYLYQDLKLFHKLFPEDVPETISIEFNGLSTVNEKIEFYETYSDVFVPQIEKVISESKVPTPAKMYNLNHYQRSVYSNEFNEHVKFFNYKLTDFPYSTIGRFKHYLPVKEIEINSTISVEIAVYRS
jgi:hypothetical protein